MREPFTRKLAESSVCLKCANYWQSVFRFGLPFILIYRGIEYAAFRMTAGKMRLPFPWRFELPMDILVMFVASTLWWLLMREIAAWRRKNQER
jgi:hypothetical protein